MPVRTTNYFETRVIGIPPDPLAEFRKILHVVPSPTERNYTDMHLTRELSQISIMDSVKVGNIIV